MGIDEPRNDDEAASVDHLVSGARYRLGRHRHDAVALDGHVGVLEHADGFVHGDDSGTGDHDAPGLAVRLHACTTRLSTKSKSSV
jgi:hypothetical protein